jgi:uncharacterized membrane protein
MPTRVRKLIGSVLILVFLFAYVALVVTLADHVPDQAFVKFAFFALAGTLWGAPLIPLLKWMNGGR